MAKIYTNEQFLRDTNMLYWDLLNLKDEWYPDLILGIVRGGAVPAVYLSHMSGIPCDMMVWQTRDGAENHHRYDLIDDFIGKQGKNILIVDDINDSGKTFQSIWEDWIYFSLEEVEKHVRFACLFDRHSSKFKADYNVNHLTTDEWVIFPWEPQE